MARVLIITHGFDDFMHRDYLLHSLAPHWVAAGHQVLVAVGLVDWPPADIAILHVDLSVVPAAYAEACRRYAVVVNGAVGDIRKRQVSQCLVQRGDDWPGQVIVKTDLNCRGLPEREARRQAQDCGARADSTAVAAVDKTQPYRILRSIHEVPESIWNDPDLVVERFLAERDERRYWMRIWIFLGDRERCARLGSDRPIVKGANVVARQSAQVPDELRALRARLGFDYGKFDFVMHDGRPVLFDANRTPSAAAPHTNRQLARSNAELAHGLDAFLRAPPQAVIRAGVAGKTA